MSYCTQQELENHIGTAQLTQLTNDAWEVDAPYNLVVEGAAGGNVTVESFYVVTALNDKGETVKSDEITFVPDVLNKTAVLNWDSVSQAKTYKVYKTILSGSYVSPCLLVHTDQTTYSDDGSSILIVGAPPVDSTKPNTAIVNDMIEMADNEINAKVGCTYLVPFVAGVNCTSIPKIITEISQDMSLYNCFMRRISAFEVPKQWIEAHKDAVEKLDKIAEMDIYLDGSPQVIGKEAEIVVETDDKTLDFNDENSAMNSF
jgi:hypothetical protein